MVRPCEMPRQTLTEFRFQLRYVREGWERHLDGRL
jgi:hypothetical protein